MKRGSRAHRSSSISTSTLRRSAAERPTRPTCGRLRPDLDLASDALQFFVWANTYDARAGEPVWWWARKAERLGATAARPCRRRAARRHPAWVDGGPRGSVGAVVDGRARRARRVGRRRQRCAFHRRPSPHTAELAPDQLAAVAHGAGPAPRHRPGRVGQDPCAHRATPPPARDRGYEPESTLRRRLQQEGAAGDGAAPRRPVRPRVQTLNALGLCVARRRAGGGAPACSTSARSATSSSGWCRRSRRRANTDPIGPYIEGLIADPARLARSGGGRGESRRRRRPRRAVRAVPAALARPRRRRLRRADLRRRRGAAARRRVPPRGAAPAPPPPRRRVPGPHAGPLLLVRLAGRARRLDVFGVGDDDQVIYGYAGADPRFLIDFERLLPAARRRTTCGSTTAARSRSSTRRARCSATTSRRVPKTIAPGPAADTSAGALRVRARTPRVTARPRVRSVVDGWLRSGTDAREVAVLARVQSLLLAPHVALVEAGVPVDSILSDWVLDRVGSLGRTGVPAHRGVARQRARQRS